MPPLHRFPHPMPTNDIHTLSLAAPPVNLAPGERHSSARRLWQGIPGIERTRGGRLYATWYSGGATEGVENHVLLVTSTDDGLAWSQPLLVIDPPGDVRAFDPVLWLDPQQRLWLFWSQSQGQWNGRGGVWFIRCDTPDAPNSAWTAPRRIANGVMMNKPFVRSDGEWLLPISGWGAMAPILPELAAESGSNTYSSRDQGVTFTRTGGALVPHRTFDEHMLAERRDGSLWMLVRTIYGIGQSVSTDGGATWCRGWPTDIAGPDSRFHLRRLASGRLLLVNHVGFTGRSHLTASLSDDDGRTWGAHLLLDERADVSYPDATVADDGRIRVIYDRERYNAREILLASFTEADVLAGRMVGDGGFLKRIIHKIPGSPA